MAYAGIYQPIVLFSDPISGPPSMGLSPSVLHTGDISELGGNGRISGTVKNLGTPDFPVWRRVRLFTRRTGALVREVWSDAATGAYDFTGINPTLRYTVVAYDHTGQYNAVVSDDITPEVMP